MGITLFAPQVSATMLVFGKHTDNTCTIRGDWRYIKQIDESIGEVRARIAIPNCNREFTEIRTEVIHKTY